MNAADLIVPVPAVTVDLLARGGVVMWPLLILSVLGLTLVLERAWFFARTGGLGGTRRFTRLSAALRARSPEAQQLAANDRTVYGAAARHLLSQGPASAVEAIELQRPRVERFLPTLSTIITAAPMLGILGTVLGIIASFEVLGDASAPPDPAAVGAGIGQALLTTAAGLVVALGVLLPYNLFRVQADRTLGRLELLAEAAAGAAEPPGVGG